MIFFNSANIVIAIAFVALAVEGHDENGTKKAKCLDSPRHKGVPGPENLPKCEVYRNNSCCTNETSLRIYGNDLYVFKKMLCNKHQDLTPECKKFFLKDACFYECSPDVGAWATEEDGVSIVRNIPLCKSDCDDWFAACSNDFTCTTDWRKAHEQKPDFKCSDSDKCQTIKDKFKSADDFCRKVWGNSYTVVPDDQECLKINLKNKADIDQNKEAAEHHQSNSCPNVVYNIVILGVPLLYFSSNLV